MTKAKRQGQPLLSMENWWL